MCGGDIELTVMTTSRVLLSLLIHFAIRSSENIIHGSITQNATAIFVNGSWKTIPNDNFSVHASEPGQSSQEQTCFPKSWNVLLERSMIVEPKNNCSPVEILLCYCLTLETQSSIVNTDPLPHMSFGNCLFGCFATDTLSLYHQVDTFVDEHFANGTCSHFNHKGTLCGQCKDGYGPAVYSFSLKCVECDSDIQLSRVFLYILVASRGGRYGGTLRYMYLSLQWGELFCLTNQIPG